MENGKMKLIINQLCDERQQNLTISEYNYRPRCFYLKLIHMVMSKATSTPWIYFYVVTLRQALAKLTYNTKKYV